MRLPMPTARILLVAAILFGASVLDSSPAYAQSTSSTSTIPDDEYPGLGEIIGSPDPGPKPTDAGDRGGLAQLGLAVLMIGGVAFILRKVFREANRPHADESRAV